MTAESKTHARLEGLVGSTLKTLERHREFEVIDVSRQWVVVRPSAGKGERQIKRERIEEIAALHISRHQIAAGLSSHSAKCCSMVDRRLSLEAGRRGLPFTRLCSR